MIRISIWNLIAISWHTISAVERHVSQPLKITAFPLRSKQFLIKEWNIEKIQFLWDYFWYFTEQGE